PSATAASTSPSNYPESLFRQFLGLGQRRKRERKTGGPDPGKAEKRNGAAVVIAQITGERRARGGADADRAADEAEREGEPAGSPAPRRRRWAAPSRPSGRRRPRGAVARRGARGDWCPQQTKSRGCKALQSRQAESAAAPTPAPAVRPTARTPPPPFAAR